MPKSEICICEHGRGDHVGLGSINELAGGNWESAKCKGKARGFRNDPEMGRIEIEKNCECVSFQSSPFVMMTAGRLD